MVSRSVTVTNVPVLTGTGTDIHTSLFKLVELRHDHGHINPGSSLVTANAGSRQRRQPQPIPAGLGSGFAAVQQRPRSPCRLIRKVTNTGVITLSESSDVCLDQAASGL